LLAQRISIESIIYVRKEHKMSKVEQIKVAIESLPDKDFVKLRKWFSEKDWEKWDRQIEEDSKDGKLDFLTREAFKEKQEGKLKDL